MMRKGVKTMSNNKIKKPRDLSFILMNVPSIFQKKHVPTVSSAHLILTSPPFNWTYLQEWGAD